MSIETARPARPIPAIVTTLNPLVRRLLHMGMPMGQNALFTVRGRTSGRLRTFPITLLEADGKRYVFAAFGEVDWVRNLRAAGEATVQQGRRKEHVLALELTPEAAAPVLRTGLAVALGMKVVGTMVAGWYGITAESTPEDYRESARNHPGFELRTV